MVILLLDRMNKKEKNKYNLIKAGSYSLDGLRSAWKYEIAFKLEVLFLIVSMPFAVFLGETLFKIVALICVILIVIVVELINSAIEAVVDRIGTDYNDLSGRAKDMGSAAVLVSIFLAIIVWVSVIIEKFS